MDVTTEFQESYNEFLFRKADMLKLPLMGTFELTPICNMNCEMCYIRQDSKSVSDKGGLKDLIFWERVFDQAIEAGMLFCLLTGGEIFTYPHFRTLYDLLCRKGIHIVLNTNATLLERETVAWLAQHPPRRLNISLYGSCRDTYAKLCHNPAGFDQVVRAFELLTEYQIPFRVHGVLVPANSKDYEGIKEVCNRFRVPLQMSYYMFPPIRKENGCIQLKERFTPDEMAKVALNYRKDQCGGEGERWHRYLEEKCACFDRPENMKCYGYNKIACRSGCSAFWVNWKGQVSGCGMEDGRAYDLTQHSFREAWDRIVDDTKKIRLSERCAICQYRDICPVCASAAVCETGRIDGTPEYLCQFANAFADLLRQERKGIE